MLTTLDYIILGFAALCSIWAAIKGFISEVSSKFGYVIGFAVAMMFTVVLEPFVESRIGLPVWLASFLTYVFLFLVGYVLIQLLGNMLENITESAHLGAINNILGLILGLLEAIIIVGFTETMLSSQSFLKVSPYINGSYISGKIILPVFKVLRNWVLGLL